MAATRASGSSGSSGAPRKRAARVRTAPVKWGTIIPATIGALLIPFAVGYAFAVFILFPAPKVEPGTNGIAVPNLVGRTVADAQELLSSANLGTIDTMMLPNPTVAIGQILAQDPLPGQQLRAGSKVSVSVSGGAPSLRIPDVTGLNADAADELLKKMGFQTNRQDETSGMRVGAVTRLDPMAGSNARLPATITMFVSTGSPSVDTLPAKPDTIR